MAHLEFKKNRDRYEINVFDRKGSKSHYQNVIDKDPNKFAQILIDLMIDGFPVEKAIKIFRKRIKEKDWLGL